MDIIGLTPVDILIIIALLLYVLIHIEDGFLVLTARLASFVGGALLSFLAYDQVAEFAAKFIDLPPGVLDALSFVMLFIILRSVIALMLQPLVSSVPAEQHTAWWSKLLALFPAFIDGIILISFLLFTLVVIPFLPEVKRPIEESRIGNVLVDNVSRFEVYIDEVFGRAATETLGFLTVRPEEGDLVLLPFEVTDISVDEDAESEMLRLVNKERVRAGAPPLVVDRTIVPVARAHSEDMWRRKYFAHENLDGKSPFDRMEEGGVRFRAAGENLALARTVERAHEGLMNSPGHRRNILDPEFTRVGIGVIDGGIYGKMFTQNFAD